MDESKSGQIEFLDTDHILNVIPSTPKAKVIKDKNELDFYLQRLKEGLLDAMNREYNVSISKDKSKIIFDVWLF